MSNDKQAHIFFKNGYVTKRVGDKVFHIGANKDGREEPIVEIGKKYFYVGIRRDKFEIETGRCDSTQYYRVVYSSKEVYDKEQFELDLKWAFRQAVDWATTGNNTYKSEEQIRKAAEILGLTGQLEEYLKKRK